MSNNESLHIARQKRGQIESSQLVEFQAFPNKELATLLQSDSAPERTIGATLLGQRKATEFVANLCKALITEKALYSKIAICEALENIGKDSIEPLSLLLGTIGTNQETELPEKYFEKKSYPLAKDIVARTIISIGEPAVTKLIELSTSGNNYLLSQVIDTLGGLLYKTKDLRILVCLKTIFEHNMHNEFLIWKTIRAFSAIKNKETTDLIMPFRQHPQPAIRWETIRTLGLIAEYETEIMEKIKPFTTDTNEQIKQASIDAITRINKRHI